MQIEHSVRSALFGRCLLCRGVRGRRSDDLAHARHPDHWAQIAFAPRISKEMDFHRASTS